MPVNKMATTNEILVLIDAETNSQYSVSVSNEDAEKARSDPAFASQLLHTCISTSASSSQKGSIPEISTQLDTTACQKQNTEGSYRWLKADTLLLLELYKNQESNFTGGKMPHKDCWEKIAKIMQNNNYNVSGLKCVTKYQALKRQYKVIKDHNNKSGNNRNTWEFYDIMEEIFGEKPWINPVAEAGSNLSEKECFTQCRTQATGNTLWLFKFNLDKYVRSQLVYILVSNKRKVKVDIVNFMKQSLEEKRMRREDRQKIHKEKMKQLEVLKDLLKTMSSNPAV